MPQLSSLHHMWLKKSSRRLVERALSLWLSVFVVLCAPFLAHLSSQGLIGGRGWAQSDIELLLQKERGAHHKGQAPFKLTPLLVWPVVDLRPLFEVDVEAQRRLGDTSAQLDQEPHLQEPSLQEPHLQEPSLQESADERVRLSAALSRYQNLKLISAQRLIKEPRERAAYEQLLSLARGFARRGVQSYREVELKQAQAQLESALELFEQAKHHGHEPQEVAQTHLTLGLVALERAQALRAVMAFREALLLNPRLRLSASLDGAEAARRFEEARAQLTSLPYDELTFEEDYIIIRLGDYSERVHLANAVYRLSDATLNELNTVRNGQYRFMTLLGVEIDADRNMLSSLVKEEHLVHKRFVLGTDQLGRYTQSFVGRRKAVSFACLGGNFSYGDCRGFIRCFSWLFRWLAVSHTHVVTRTLLVYSCSVVCGDHSLGIGECAFWCDDRNYLGSLG